jgi:hypothetical protein
VAHVVAPDGDTTRSWSKLIVGQMKEDRAAAILAAGRVVVIERHDDVIESIVAPHPFMACPTGQLNALVICRRGGIVAPAIEWSGRREIYNLSARGQTVAPDETAENREASDGRGAIALALVDPRARAPERAGNDEWPGDQAPSRWIVPLA